MSATSCSYCGALNQAAVQVCAACGDDLTLQPSFPGYDQTPLWEPVIDPNRPLSFIATFGTDSAVSETFSIFTSNLWLITKIVVVAVAPFELFRAISLVQLGQEIELPLWNILMNGVSKVWVVPALIYALMKIILTGREPSLHESYRWALTKAGKLGICVIIMTVLQALGYALLVIPGIIVSLVFILVYPIAVLEKGSVTEVFAHSLELTRGRRLQILGTLIIVGIPVFIGSVFSSYVVDGGATFWPLTAAVGIVSDIMDHLLTILSLVMYLSLPRIPPGSGHTVLSLK
jgi:hypothetical protein